MKKKYMISLLIIVLLVALDQITKYIVSMKLDLYQTYQVIPNFFNITYANNYGASFGILEGKRYLFILIGFAVLIYMLIEMRKSFSEKIEVTSFIFIIAGTIGNLLDRLMYGYVRDFFDFRIFGYDFAIFNAADALMVLGIILLCISLFIGGKNENRK